MNMKKLATAFAVMACVMGSASVFAKAPIIAGVPDIVIGDREDNVLTVDNNWFRYANAINVLDYVTDVDSPDSDLLFTFVEQTTSKDLGIRVEAASATVSQLDALDSATVVADWTGHEITNYGGTRDYLLTFVDLIRSPEPYGSVPYPAPAKVGGGTAGETEVVDLGWHNTEGSGTLQDASRLVWIYVADDPLASGADRVDNDAITVISRNYGYDNRANGISPVFADGFANGAGTSGAADIWVSSTFAGMTAGTAAQGSGTSGGNGYVSLASATATTNGYARWTLTNNVAPGGNPVYTAYVGAIPYITPGPGESLIYCARFTMSQNQAAPGSIPGVRFGAYQVGLLVSDVVGLGPYAGAAANLQPQTPAQNVNVVYKSVWSANEGAPEFSKLDYSATVPGVDMRGYNLFFDILDLSAVQGGTYTLSNVDVVTAPRPANVTAAATETDFRTTAGWASQGSAFTTITMNVASGAGISVTDTGTPRAAGTTPYQLLGKTFSSAVVRWDSNQLLRFKTAISVPNAVDRNGWHWFRLRENSAYFQLGHEWSFSGDDGRITTTLGGHPYVPPATPGTPFVYESYLSSQVGTFDWTALRAISGDALTVAVDAIGIGPVTGGTGSELATHFTVHSLAVENLADPF